MESGTTEVSMHDVAESSGTPIEIKVKTMDSQTYSLRVDKQMPVPLLKEQIASVTGVVTEHQRLICRGKVLKDDQLLSAYHVEDGHTLHLVVREPASSSSENLPADPAFDQSYSGARGQFYQVAPGIVVETFNMPGGPGQGDRVLPDISRILSAVLGSIGVPNPGNGSEGTGARDQGAERHAGTPVASGTTDGSQTQPEQSGMRGQSDRSRLRSAFGIPAAVSFGSLQAPVVPDALTTLSQYLSHMSQEFINNGRANENNDGGSASHVNEGGSSGSSAQSENPQQGLPSPASLAELLSSTRQMLNQQIEECLLQLATQLGSQANMTDPEARVNAQSSALRTGVLLQNLGAYFLELGRTVTTLRLGGSPSEAVVNAGPAVFISPSGPNPLMVQALPFQPGTSFSTPISGTAQSGSGVTNGLGTGFVPRRIDIQIRRVGASAHQAEPTGSQPSSGQRPSSTSEETPMNQPTTRASDAPSSNNGAPVRILPFRTMMAAVPDLNRLPSESPGGSLGLLFPSLGRYSNLAAGNVSSRTVNLGSGGHHSSGIQSEPHRNTEAASNQQNDQNPAENGRVPAAGFGPREPTASRTIDINILSTGGIQNDQNSDGQIPSGILQLLRGLFPGGEFHVESDSSQATAMGSATEQGRTSSPAADEAEPRATEEGLFLSRLLQQIMPVITQDAATDQNVACPGEEDTSQQNDGTSSTRAEDSEVGTSRRQEDSNPGPSPKRQKTE